LLTHLVDRQSHALAKAWVDITKRGKGWRTRFEAGLRALQAQLPETILVIERCRRAALDFEEINRENDGDDDYQPPMTR
jgi:hypothetical protein